METVSLENFIRTAFNVAIPALDFLGQQDIAHKLNSKRIKEKKLLSLLPAFLVRRIDSGFARSLTIHPQTAKALYYICLYGPIENVFETGTCWGYSTAYLASALKKKNGGKVYTFDIYEKAGRHIPDELLPQVELIRGEPSVLTMPTVLEHVKPQLFFQDSRHDYAGVQEELEIVAPQMEKGSVILIHDFVYPEVSRAVKETLKDFELLVLDNEDPQQLGMAVKR